MKLYTIGEVAKKLGVSVERIRYAHLMGKIQEPARFCGDRAYTPEDVERVREYFARRKPYQRDNKENAV